MFFSMFFFLPASRADSARRLNVLPRCGLLNQCQLRCHFGVVLNLDALPALVAVAPVFADALSTALFAPTTFTTVFAHTIPATLFAEIPTAPVLAVS
jgi:hypothetical protein